ncbi:glycogen debranching enzyme [Deinococcus metalli]|uniref:Amylo-alpha-1,6-glucosidase n=1 Tax=Deinococcus metalli TaxID=1141878 RepID=A0A7W8KFA5_9DEIO|nr:glycogen debranching N-terminal domain-containing protein [Deinococcus metalli]MBB5376693.1 glycogen debranching enzyme [Deinococcus metalli]GHF65841.1 amylo-alpha-1,6-glucosidase [Deinococcus metalli]
MLSTRTVLKENELYLVGDDRYAVSSGEAGFYRRDTRHLSVYRWQLDGQTPQTLVQYLRAPFWMSEQSGNADLGYTMHTGLTRDLTVSGGGLQDRVVVRTYSPESHVLRLDLAADFVDMFEVRGWPALEGRVVSAQPTETGVTFAYTARDGLQNSTVVTCTPPGRWDGSGLEWTVEGQPGGTTLEVTVTVHALHGDEAPVAPDPGALGADYARWVAPVTLPDAADQRVLDRSVQDLRSLLFHTRQGPFPAAGLPWFVAPFGRDSLIIAHLVLPHFPEIAVGVARYLAARQGVTHDPATLEEPGKILHEERTGELTRLGQTVFQPYYGSADSTPLFVWLVGELARTHPELATELRPHWHAALAWMMGDGDPDQDGLIEYTPHAQGIRNQVWKDSGDSTFGADDTDAEGAIAVIEVQGYAYAAYLAGAQLSRLTGDDAQAAEYEQRARRVQARVQEAFWWPERGYYAHALDGDKRPLRVLVSNPAHSLWTGVIPAEHAGAVVQTALGPELYSGWGLRTLGTHEVRYNPVSYHNGSVWPHDTAVFALGLERYGFTAEARRVSRDLYDAARWAQDARLPELFAGFTREDGPPVPYPAACHPQGWDAAIPLALAHLIDRPLSGE